ncbi:MAG: DUF4236 domain-containing protein [Candidatus Krumholzibacteria bacterium]
MAFRFWRRIKLAPGVTLNLSKTGGSLSFGPRGGKFTVGPRGRRASFGIPGTGLFYMQPLGGGKTRRARDGARRRRSAASGATEDTRAGDAPTRYQKERASRRLTLGFFKRLITPDDEETLVAGLREHVLGNEDAALELFEKSAHLADSAFLAGFLSLKRNRLAAAARHFETAAENHRRLGRYLGKYGITAEMVVPITGELLAVVSPNLRGTLLGLVETYQLQKKWDRAIETLEHLRRLVPGDLVITLSLAELLIDRAPDDKITCDKVVRLAKGVRNESDLHAALLLYKAKALRGLGLSEAARDLLSKTLRRRAGRTAELLHALRYDRALLYETMGQKKRARRDFEKIYVEDPDYEHVRERLGIPVDG